MSKIDDESIRLRAEQDQAKAAFDRKLFASPGDVDDAAEEIIAQMAASGDPAKVLVAQAAGIGISEAYSRLADRCKEMCDDRDGEAAK
jgi:hypothetical protein